jgi:glyoxylate carboligase
MSTSCQIKNKQNNYIQVSQKWRTNGALRCRRDYRKRQKNVKKILLDLFSDLAVFECGT